MIAAISRGKSGRYEIPSEICQLLHFTCHQVAPETLVNPIDSNSIKMSDLNKIGKLENHLKLKIEIVFKFMQMRADCVRALIPDRVVDDVHLDV